MRKIVLLCGLLAACAGQEPVPAPTTTAAIATPVAVAPPPAVDVCDPTVTNPYLQAECDRREPRQAVARGNRDQAAREFCGYQGAIANATAPGGIVGQAFAGIEVQAACINYYRRTGALPGQM